MYTSYPWHDLWMDCNLMDAVHYVRGSKRLSLTAEWRAVIPKSLPEDSESECDY